jgi:hypothetical protein
MASGGSAEPQSQSKVLLRKRLHVFHAPVGQGGAWRGTGGGLEVLGFIGH